MTTRGDIHQTLIRIDFLREYPLVVDDHVLHASDEARWGVGEMPQIGRQMGYGSAQVSDREGCVARVRIVLRDRINGRLLIRREQKVR